MPDTRSLAQRIEDGERNVITLLFAGMTLVTVMQVILRYVFNAGFVWALELTTTLFSWFVFFGMSYGLKHGIHLGVDALVKLFPARAQRVLSLLAVAAGLAYAGLMFGGAYSYTERLYEIGIEMIDLPVQRWIVRIILPVGFLLLAYRLLEAGYRIWTGRMESLLTHGEASLAVEQFKQDPEGPEAEQRGSEAERGDRR